MKPSDWLRPIRGPLLLLVGLAIEVLYLLLGVLHVGKFGQPADIGGGIIPLVGLILLACGLVSLMRSLVLFARERSAKRKRARNYDMPPNPPSN